MMEPFSGQRRVFVTKACDYVCECIYILYIKTNLLTPNNKKKKQINRLIYSLFYFSKVRCIEIPPPSLPHTCACVLACTHPHTQEYYSTLKEE